jgi:phosphoglycolate phosphatase-like HAD superfamily hydrolase
LSNLLIFDLDGVITSEEAYWDAAGLTLHELLYSSRYWNLDNNELDAGDVYQPATNAQESRRISRTVFPEPEILALKARSINSNWDTCYVAACLQLIDLLASLPDCSSLLPLEPWDDRWIARFRERITTFESQEERNQQGRRKRPLPAPRLSRRYADFAAVFEDAIFRGSIGLELINRLDVLASAALGYTVVNVFSRHSPFWQFCRNIFQEWYLGDTLFTETYGHAPSQPGKPGCIHFEKPLLPLEQIHDSLETLRGQGYVLGFATGRVWQEAVYPLKMYGLLEYFDEQHLSTYDDVERAEADLRTYGDQTLLSKPNPFPFLIAANKDKRDTKARPESFVVIGDATSDILGGRAAGAITIAVMTGALTPEACALLAQSNPDFMIADMTRLPDLLEHIDGLATIQQMQFTEQEKAERLLQRWFARHMNLKTESVTLTPKAVSLNSFNGFYHNDGEEYFFKTHIEEQGILEEYYHAGLLNRAGYNIVRPLRTIHEEGQQMVIYPVVSWPIVFDLMRDVETGVAKDGTFDMLVSAEKRECARLLDIYRSTYTSGTAEEHARAPIHQLFWHRLTGGRYKNFYEGKLVPLPKHDPTQENHIPFNELLKCRWNINGVSQQRTLGELIERAKVVLNPAQAALTIIGHGDAHFGNIFLENEQQAWRPQGSPLHFNMDEIMPRYLYFDPAFAGRHSPLLDVVKPLFHNVFATWMYFPLHIAQSLHLTVSRGDKSINVEHAYRLTPVREAILQTKKEYLLRPLIAELRARDALPAEWEEIVQLAMMCCALLTINLLDGERMPPSITWLGLLLAVQTGNSGIQPWGYYI